MLSSSLKESPLYFRSPPSRDYSRNFSQSLPPARGWRCVNAPIMAQERSWLPRRVIFAATAYQGEKLPARRTKAPKDATRRHPSSQIARARRRRFFPQLPRHFIITTYISAPMSASRRLIGEKRTNVIVVSLGCWLLSRFAANRLWSFVLFQKID